MSYRRYQNSFLIYVQLFFLALLCHLLLFENRSHSQSNNNFVFGANLEPSIQLGLNDGTNQSGSRTIFQGNSINFGTVSFIHPELVSNGDAYIETDLLRLEAIMEVSLSFSGINLVTVDLTRLATSENSFHRTQYSLSTNRSSSNETILMEPQFNTIKRLSSSETFNLKILCDIAPQQKGELIDRFRLTATSQ